MHVICDHFDVSFKSNHFKNMSFNDLLKIAIYFIITIYFVTVVSKIQYKAL